MTLTLVFGVLSILMTVISRANYFYAVWQGKTKPHAFSWFIWGTVSSIGTAAQVLEGAGAGAWARILASISNFVLAGVALRRDMRVNIRPVDWATLAVALLAIPLWIATKTPVWSVILVCIIDTIGYVPTLRKSWHRPHEETARSYTLSAFSAIFSVLAVEHYSLSTWLYPAVLGVTNVGMVAYLLTRRRSHARKQKAAGAA